MTCLPRSRTACALSAVLLLLLMLCAPLRAGERPALMLAQTWHGDAAVADYWVSEKLDGVRGRWDGQALWTRGGQRIAVPGWFVEDWPAVPLDGELWIARGEFESISALVRSATPDPEAWRAVRFMLFDLPGHGGPFAQRVRAMRDLVEDVRSPHLAMIDQRRLGDARSLDILLREVVAAGGEGLMLHHTDAHYRDGRSDALLKLKPFDDAEGIVVDYTVGRGKYRGLVGALVLRLDSGRLLKLGSGLSDAERHDPPPLGSRVTFRYSGLTSTGLPRFARYIRVRHE